MGSQIDLCLVLLVFLSASSGMEHCSSPVGVPNSTLPSLRMNSSSTSNWGSSETHHRSSKSSSKIWCSALGRISNEYIELDFGEDIRLSAFETEGVKVWNGTTKRYDLNYVKRFYLAYKRSSDEHWRWRQYRENEVTVTLFRSKGSTIRYKLLTPRVARYARFVAISAKGSMACFKIELYGCPWANQDGLVSYRVSQGNGRANGPGLGDLRDVGYDGRRLAYGTKRGVLSGGLGQLVDGVLGRNAPWKHINDTAWISWIGWRDPITEHPTITFRFSTIRRFQKMRIHVLNQPGAEKLLFGKVVVSFSNDGEYYSWKTVFEPSLQKRRIKNRAFFLEVTLDDHQGKYVTCDFYYHGWWILLSEIEFDSDIPVKRISFDSRPQTTMKITNPSRVAPSEKGPSIRESNKPKKKGLTTGDIVRIISITAGVIGGVLFMLGVGIFLRKKCRKTQNEPYPNPIRIVNRLKKNSINRNNDLSSAAVKRKLKEIENDSQDLDPKKRNPSNEFQSRLTLESKREDDNEDDLKLQIIRELEDEEEEEVFSKLNSWKTNYGESLFKNIITSEDTANLRPESRELTLEEEKALVLEEMRKLSDGDNVEDPSD